ncbi:MAG: hypothetical protein FWD30_00205 [Dehalococcoidia bacterium]|nr:hypothetical protein [Dehalococcoidia bacterium]MCL2615215.1 hypothetical protein [Dehalococcoidia bacterium]
MSHLKDGEKAELYECWALEESEARNTMYDQVENLQAYIDNRDITIPSSEHAEHAKKHFITYNAPFELTCSTKTCPNAYFSNYIKCSDVITIYADKQEESIPYSLADRVLGC